jgi:hypothetical protein
MPSWWVESTTCARAGTPPARPNSAEHIVRSLFDTGASKSEAFAAACLCPRGIATAMSWINGYDEDGGVSVATGAPAPSLVSDADQEVRDMLEGMGFPRDQVVRALRENVSRDVEVLLEWLTLQVSSVAEDAQPVLPGQENVPDIFPVEDMPAYFREQALEAARQRGNYVDVERMLLDAANTWGLRNYLLSLGYAEDLAMQVARETNNRRSAAYLAGLLSSGLQTASAPAPLARAPSQLSHVAISPTSFGQSPSWTYTNAMWSSMSVLRKALSLMRSSATGHPLTARMMFDLQASLPYDNACFEGWASVYGARLLVEAASIYEVTHVPILICNFQHFKTVYWRHAPALTINEQSHLCPDLLLCAPLQQWHLSDFACLFKTNGEYQYLSGLYSACLHLAVVVWS